ncbi:hypothetical protein DV735_g2443, partial [Chaetothyriales sp. CBS 134920]
MTKKKRNHPDLEEVLARPWCYYCERDFDDLKILINHQKAKHFKCERCGRRLNTAGGLSVHMSQVHKENLTAVDNALPNRVGLDIEIFGMEGIPEDIVQQHTQRVLTAYHQAQAERQAATGNPAPGSSATNGQKKLKLESASDLKKRLAEHKAAKLAAEQGDGSQSERSTPQPVAPPKTSPPNGYVAAAAAYGAYQQPQQPFVAAPPNGAYSPPPSYSPGTGAPGLGQQPVYPSTAPAQLPFGHAPAAAPYQPQPYFQPQAPGSYPPQPAFSPPPHQSAAAFATQPYPPVGSGQYSSQANGVRFAPGAAAHGFAGHTSPPSSANFPLPIATGSVSLPTAPGLPQRPAFGAPPVNAFQFQQMHQGQLPSSQNHVTQPQYRAQNSPPNPGLPQAQQQTHASAPLSASQAPSASSIDDLIASASRQAAATAAASAGSVAAPAHTDSAEAGTHTPAPEAEDKVAKKDKEKAKATRLVYSDNTTSPEEKMATLPSPARQYCQTTTDSSMVRRQTRARSDDRLEHGQTTDSSTVRRQILLHGGLQLQAVVCTKQANQIS